MKWKHKKIVNERFLEFSSNNFSDWEKEYPEGRTLRVGLVLYYSTLCSWDRLYIDPLEKLIQGDLLHIYNKLDDSIYPEIILYDELTENIRAFLFNWPLSDTRY